MLGCEGWTVSKQVQRKIWRQQINVIPSRMLRISWTTKKSNETVLQEPDTIRSPINRIRKRQSGFWPCDELARTSCDYWKDRGKQGIAV